MNLSTAFHIIGFTRVGNIIGTSISAAVLLILCLANIYILVSLIKNLRSELARAHLESSHHGHATTSTDQCSLQEDSSPPAGTTGGGIMMRLLHFLFKSVDRPWKMYPLGVVFGLGFDTSSEIAILGISSLQALQGTSLWLILIFPVLFTCKLRKLLLFSPIPCTRFSSIYILLHGTLLSAIFYTVLLHLHSFTRPSF